MDTKSKEPHQILLVDDHPVCGSGLDRITRFDNEFRIKFRINPKDEFPKAAKPVVVVSEISSADRQGIAIVKEIGQCYPKAAILVLSHLDESIFAERCLKAGAKGYVTKKASPKEILSALRTVVEGRIYTSENIQAQILNRVSGGTYSSNLPSADALSDRELLIIQRIGESRNNREIAKELQISIKTIESHRSRIKSKLKLSSPNELVRYAVQLQAASF